MSTKRGRPPLPPELRRCVAVRADMSLDAIQRVVDTRLEYERMLAQIEAVRQPHNYCFTVSDDETCDAGWGDCRLWLTLLHREMDSLRASIAWLQQHEVTLAQQMIKAHE